MHIELKRRGIELKEAFNQIRRYQNESFSAANRLFEFVQIFIISNGTYSKYYSNSKRDFKSLNDNYAFVMSFSDSQNNKIEDLEDFTKTFLTKRTLLNILTKYCVFNTNQELLIMRPYQICACEKIIDKIRIAHTYKLYGSTQGGGYIWHSTGSGKTLTSFKTALLATKFDFIDKVLFVVDRKDLDYQTQKEYDRFEKDAANATRDTRELQRRLEDKSSKILITTIQKLSNFIKKYENSAIFHQEIVFIFDECHRSQFGAMHQSIIKKFKKYYIFGFTGTPIFPENAATYGVDKQSGKAMLQTTQSTFGECLHSYTILNAIRDKNVLPFKVSYHSTTTQSNPQEKKVKAINTEEALMSKERIQQIVSYILENFNRHTKRQNAHTLQNQRLKGFNAIFATASVEAAKRYYAEFMRIKADICHSKPFLEGGESLNQSQDSANQDREFLKIGIIYSYEPNEDLDELDELCSDKRSAKEFLRSAIEDYNAHFQSNFSLESFDSYYKDISQKVKQKELDLLIVVNMFLTGFDSKTINTLYVDKNLKHHSLLQAYSRTNRILNAQKAYGNIICFRDLEAATNESLKMFGDERASSIVLLEKFEVYFQDYCHKISAFQARFSSAQIATLDMQSKKDFINAFSEILKLKNILDIFDEFGSAPKPISDFELQDYQSHYLELHREFKSHEEKESILDNVRFEVELIAENDITADYILHLLQSYHQDQRDTLKVQILKSIAASPALRDKSKLIEEFLDRIDKQKNRTNFQALFNAYMRECSQKELEAIIAEFSLDAQKTQDYLDQAFRLNFFQDKGEVYDLLPKVNIFAPNAQSTHKRAEAILSLKAFFEKYREFLRTHKEGL